MVKMKVKSTPKRCKGCNHLVRNRVKDEPACKMYNYQNPNRIQRCLWV